MSKSTQNNPVVRQDELAALSAEIAGALVELLNRTTRLAEVTASIAMVLKEHGLIEVEVTEPDENGEVEVTLPEPPEPALDANDDVID